MIGLQLLDEHRERNRKQVRIGGVRGEHCAQPRFFRRRQIQCDDLRRAIAVVEVDQAIERIAQVSYS